jgi:hypothetical protein
MTRKRTTASPLCIFSRYFYMQRVGERQGFSRLTACIVKPMGLSNVALANTTLTRNRQSGPLSSPTMQISTGASSSAVRDYSAKFCAALTGLEYFLYEGILSQVWKRF